MGAATFPSSLSLNPLVSIVTPSLNSARFIADTIESVLSQDYPNIEYIVMDGGSSDGTAAIAERHSGKLQFVSQPDSGAADAINKAFLLSHGEVFAWLSADDTYLPGAVTAAVAGFLSRPDAGVVYGLGSWMDESGATLEKYPVQIPCDFSTLSRECGLCQPACFIRREAFQGVGMLDAALQSAFDYDLWIRLSRICVFSPVPVCLAMSRMHGSNKSLSERRVMFRESMELLKRHYGYVPLSWVYGYLSFLRDGRDQFFEPLRQSPATYLASLPVGAYYNFRRVPRYVHEWMSRLATARKRDPNPENRSGAN